MIKEWIAQYRNEGGQWDEIGRNASIDALKASLSPDKANSEFVVFLPELVHGPETVMSDDEYFELVSAANDGKISSVIRTEDPAAIESAMTIKGRECGGRCFLVIYADGGRRCECLAGASGRGAWLSCGIAP